MDMNTDKKMNEIIEVITIFGINKAINMDLCLPWLYK